MNPPSDTIKGYEILYFEDAEMTKTNTSPSSNPEPSKGVLKVLYFPELEYFILTLNDICYPLLDRLTITHSDESETKSRTYTLPLQDGFYILKLAKIPNPEPIQNFETILNDSCRFFYEKDSNIIQQEKRSPKGESYESFLQSIGGVESVEDKHRKDPKFKKSMFAKAASTISKVFGGTNKNVNMTAVRTIDELKDVSKDFLMMYEFPREEVEVSVNFSRKIVDVNQESWETKVSETVFSSFVVSYPIEVTETEERLIKEIKINRGSQEKSREKQQRQREKELMCITKERELQDQLNSLRDEKMRIEISQREQIFANELSKRDTVLHIHENQFAREAQEFKNRERTLVDEIQSKIMELRQKEELTQEEQAEFARREQELNDLNKRLESERSEMEKRHQAMGQEAQVRESEMKEKDILMEKQKGDFERKEAELRGATEQRISELQKKEKMTEEERVEFKRKQQELEKMNKSIEKERSMLSQKMKDAQTKTDRELAELKKKEQMAETERAEFMRKQKELETEVRNRLAELKKKEKLSEAEASELQKREKELDKMMRKAEAEQMNLQKKEEKLVDKIKKRESELQERERMTENERSELNKIKERLTKETKLTEAERKDLESMRDKLIKEAEQREVEIIRREKLTEAERKELERKEKEGEEKLQRRLAELREKEKLTEEERREMSQREEQLVKMTRVREMELTHSKKKLEEISKHERELLAQNERMVKGHMEIQQNVVDLQEELEKPMTVTERVETTKVTSGRASETKTGEKRQRKEQKSEGMVGSQETTTSG